MADEKQLKLTQEEGFLLLTGARLFDKLVAGVTIHSQQRDELIREIIGKLAELVSPQMETMSNELAEAIVDSVLGCDELDDDELDELEMAYLESDMDEMWIHDFFQEQSPRQLSIEGLEPGERSPEPGGEDRQGFFSEQDDLAEPSSYRFNEHQDHLRRNQDSGHDFFNLPEEESEGFFAPRQMPRFPRLPRSSDHLDHLTSSFDPYSCEETFAYPMYTVDDKLPLLEKALVHHKCVRVNYYSIARETVDTIDIDPLVLLQEDGMWMVVAYCHQRNDIYLFRADRMKDVEETEQTFNTPKDIGELRCRALAAYK